MSAEGASLAGRVAAVTGASSGIGRALALEIADRGGAVVLAGRDGSALARARQRIVATAEGAGVRVVPGDLRHPETIPRILDAARDLGPLDVFVNAAAVGYPGPVAGGQTEHWREMLETNVLALCRASRKAIGAFGSRGGHLVNVSSAAARGSSPGDAVYGATKHAASAFTRSLAEEVRDQGIHVVLVEPGQVLTSFGRHTPRDVLWATATSLGLDLDCVPSFAGGHAPDDFLEHVHRHCPGVFLRAEEVARAIADALSFPPPARLTLLAPQPPGQRGEGGAVASKERPA